MDWIVENDIMFSSTFPSSEPVKQEIKEEKVEKIPVNIEHEEEDFQIKSHKVDCSSTKLNSANTFLEVSETLENLKEEPINEAPSLISNDPPPKTTGVKGNDQNRKDLAPENQCNALVLKGSLNKDLTPDFLKDYVVPESYIKLRSCNSKCHLRISEDDQKYNFESYWQKVTFSSRCEFIYNMTEVKENQKHKTNPSFRSSPYCSTFYLNLISSGRGRVCRNCFQLTLNELKIVINTVLDQKWKEIEAELGNENVPELITLEEESLIIPGRIEIKDHIKKFPLCGSYHFTECGTKKYLPIEIKEEKDKRIPVNIEYEEEDLEIKDHKVECSSTEFNSTFLEVLDTLESLKEEPTNEALSLISNNGPPPKNTEQKIKDKVENQTKLRRIWRPLDPCVKHCHLRVKENEQKRIFYSYWHNESIESRTKFVNDMTEVIPLKQYSNEKSTIVYDRQICTVHFLKTDEGDMNVCDTCFYLILGEQKDFIIEVLTEKLEKVITSLEFKKSKEEDHLETMEPQDSLKNEVSNEDIPLSKTEYNALVFKGSIHQGSAYNFLKDYMVPESYIKLRSCINKCHLRISEDDQKYNFETYWQKATFTSKCRFIYDMTELIDNQLHRENPSLGLSPYYSTFYLNPNSSRRQRRVCRNCFQLTLNEVQIIIQTVLDKKWIEIQAILENKNLPELIIFTDEETKKIEEHIKKFPLCESHHFADCGTRKYLPIGLTVRTMYDLFRNEGSNPGNISAYLRILEQMGLKFVSSFLGKCEKCDIATKQLKLTSDSKKKSKIHNILISHLESSRYVNKIKTIDENRPNKARFVYSFGFQPSLPTPFLENSTAFYKRPLWTYNFTVTGISNKSAVSEKSKCYMWDETQGKKTVNEIASCLYQHLQNLPPRITSVILYSSSCNGESRSKTLCMMLSYLLSNHKTLNSLEHKFLVDGHSQDEKNQDNEWIQEIWKQHIGKIEQPQDWYNVFKKSNKFEVVVMTPDIFYDFKSLWKDPSNGSKSFIDEDVKWVLYNKNGFISYKNHWGNTFELMNWDLERESQFKNFSKEELCRLDQVPLAEERKKDLLDLLPLLSPEAGSFYRGLPVQKDLPQKDVDSNVLDQKGTNEGGKISVVPLESKLKKIDKQKDIKLPIQTCIIKEEMEIESDSEVQAAEDEEPPKKIPKKTSDFDTENIECSTTGFSLYDNFANDLEFLQKSVDPIATEINGPSRQLQALRSWAQQSPCDKACHWKVKDTDQERIFNSYWQGATVKSRIDFVNNMTEMVLNEKLSVKSRDYYRKIHYTIFYLNTNEGRKEVCRTCFRHILGECNSFITKVLEKKLTAIRRLKK